MDTAGTDGITGTCMIHTMATLQAGFIQLITAQPGGITTGLIMDMDITIPILIPILFTTTMATLM